jgi:MFS family permease
MGGSPPSAPAVRRAPLAALLVANAISLVGNQLTVVAIPWFVLQSTGSAARAAQVGALGALAAVVAAFVGGGLADRLGARRTSIATDLASGLAVATIPLLHHTGGLAFWQLLPLVFLRALLNTPGGAARQSLLPALIQRAGLRLERGNAAYQAVQNFSQLAGPALAGLLIAALGTSNVLWIDAATFVASAGLAALAIPATLGRPRPRDGGAASPGFVAELREGVRFLRRDRPVFAIAVTATLGNFLGAALFAVILPVYARDRFGSAVALGLILAGWGGGAVAGALLYGGIGPLLPRRALLIAGAALNIPPVVLLAVAPSLPLAGTVGALALMGLCGGAANPLAFTLLQERVPERLRGRVFGAVFALGGVAAPLAVLLAGYALEGAGLAATLLGEVGGFLALAAWLALNPALRQIGPSAAARHPRDDSAQ